MFGRSEHEALIERLRAELTEAEERFRQANTPESKSKALANFERALSRYSGLVLRGEVPEDMTCEAGQGGDK
jgi:hypothetical protein